MENNLLNKIPIEGSLGLLAYGYRGLMAWRQAKKEFEQETGNSIQNLYWEELEIQKPKHKEKSNEKS